MLLLTFKITNINNNVTKETVITKIPGHQCVTFITASVCSSNHPTSACPDSWKATIFCSSLDRILLFFTLPEDSKTHKITVTVWLRDVVCPTIKCWHHFTCYHSLHGVFKVKGINRLVSLSGCVQSSFITNVCDVCTCSKMVGWKARFSNYCTFIVRGSKEQLLRN